VTRLHNLPIVTGCWSGPGTANRGVTSESPGYGQRIRGAGLWKPAEAWRGWELTCDRGGEVGSTPAASPTGSLVAKKPSRTPSPHLSAGAANETTNLPNFSLVLHCSRPFFVFFFSSNGHAIARMDLEFNATLDELQRKRRRHTSIPSS
jgi:hypothetical protein